jgi:hypothetical protein
VFYGSNHVEYPELQDPREIFDFRDSRYLNPLPEIRYHTAPLLYHGQII